MAQEATLLPRDNAGPAPAGTPTVTAPATPATRPMPAVIKKISETPEPAALAKMQILRAAG